MPTPKIGKPIAITCANANEGATVIAYNTTTGEQTTAIVAGGKAIADMSNLASGFTVGDVIVFKIEGAYFGSNTVTLTADTAAPQNVTLTMTQSTATNAPQINF